MKFLRRLIVSIIQPELQVYADRLANAHSRIHSLERVYLIPGTLWVKADGTHWFLDSQDHQFIKLRPVKESLEVECVLVPIGIFLSLEYKRIV